MARLFLIVGPTVVWASFITADWWSWECAYHCSPITTIVVGLAPLALALAIAAAAGIYSLWIIVKHRQIAAAAAILLLVCGPAVAMIELASDWPAQRAGRCELWSEARLRRLARQCAAIHRSTRTAHPSGLKNPSEEVSNPAHWRRLPMMRRFGANEMLITKNAVQINCDPDDCYTLWRRKGGQSWRLSWARGRFNRGAVIWRQCDKLPRPGKK